MSVPLVALFMVNVCVTCHPAVLALSTGLSLLLLMVLTTLKTFFLAFALVLRSGRPSSALSLSVSVISVSRYWPYAVAPAACRCLGPALYCPAIVRLSPAFCIAASADSTDTLPGEAGGVQMGLPGPLLVLWLDVQQSASPSPAVARRAALPGVARCEP